MVTCRLTHAYPDGAAPYFTVLAPARRGDEVEQWARSSARRRTHPRRRRHDHPPPRGRSRPPPVVRPQRPDPFAAALRAAKAALDPAGVLNPGVLLEP